MSTCRSFPNSFSFVNVVACPMAQNQLTLWMRTQSRCQRKRQTSFFGALCGKLKRPLMKELLDRVLAAPPAFFESLIVALLLAMGYGGSREEAGKTVGRSGDGGIDGVIDQDALGLDRVYVQAKRYGLENPVSEPEIRAFSGSLGAAKANKGVFVTTSYFTQPAQSFADRHPFKIVLIDGERLAALMIRHNVGVRIDETLYLKKIDEDFFVDE